MKFQLKGREWVADWVAASVAKKAEYDGLTDGHDCTIKFSKDIKTRKHLELVVRHELFHACMADIGIPDMHLNPDQFEELACNQFENYGPQLIKLADKLTEGLWKEREKK